MASASPKVEDYWREPGPQVAPGDVFLELPLLNPREAAKLSRHRVYLPTLIGPGVLFRTFHRESWCLPILTAEGFSDATLFSALMERVAEGSVKGWFHLPPLGLGFRVPILAGPALVYLRLVTVLDTEFLTESNRLVSLTDHAQELLAEKFIESIRT